MLRFSYDIHILIGKYGYDSGTNKRKFVAVLVI